VSALAVAPELSFNELKSTLGLSDGNLSAHSKSLQEAGYITIKKTFKGRRPHTIMRLTPLGHEAFRSYVETLRKVIEKGDKAMNGPG
jgi:DNA-binding MarR family transcriptional regulator